MTDKLLDSAVAQANDLRAQLAKNPTYQQLQLVEKFIADYQSLAVTSAKPVAPLVGNLQKGAKYGRQGTFSATMIEGAERSCGREVRAQCRASSSPASKPLTLKFRGKMLPQPCRHI